MGADTVRRLSTSPRGTGEGSRWWLTLPFVLICCGPLRADFVPVFDVVERPGTDSITGLRIVRAADGRVTLVWVHDGHVERRVIHLDGSMGAIAQLPALGFGSARDPAIAVDPTGRVLVAWEEGGRIVAHRLAADGATGTTFLLSSPVLGSARNARIAVDAQGVGAVSWERGARVEAVRIGAGSGAPLGGAQLLSDAKEDSPPEIAVDPTGDATVVWRRAGRMEYRRLRPDGSIAGPALSFDTSPCILDLPRISSRHPLSPGRPWLIARGISADGCPGGDAIRLARAADSAEFPVSISSGVGLADDPDHAVHQDAIGRRWIVWRQNAGGAGVQELYLLRATFGAQRISPEGAEIASPRLAVADGAPAMAVWIESIAGLPRVRGRRLNYTDAPGPVVTFTPSVGVHAEPVVAMQPHDRPAIAWKRILAAQDRTLVQATLEVGPPLCATPIDRSVLADGVLLLDPVPLCPGWLDGSPPSLEFTSLPHRGQVDYQMGLVGYAADGGDYETEFRFRVGGISGVSNEVAVRIRVLDASYIFIDGFENG
jgi:hypothetical protein